jgi:hypothetical protein
MATTDATVYVFVGSVMKMMDDPAGGRVVSAVAATMVVPAETGVGRLNDPWMFSAKAVAVVAKELPP